MINKKDNYAEWALLSYELSDARDHLNNLIDSMDKDDFCEEGYLIELKHIYEHLNRAWNGRNDTIETNEKNFEKNCKLPKDLKL